MLSQGLEDGVLQSAESGRCNVYKSEKNNYRQCLCEANVYNFDKIMENQLTT